MLSREQDVRMGMDGQTLARIQQLDEQARVDAKAFKVPSSQPRSGLAFDRGFQGLAVWKCGEAEGLLTGERSGGCHPVLGLAVTGGRLSPEFGDLPTTAVEPVRGTVGGKQDYVHEAVLLRTRAARKPANARIAELDEIMCQPSLLQPARQPSGRPPPPRVACPRWWPRRTVQRAELPA